MNYAPAHRPAVSKRKAESSARFALFESVKRETGQTFAEFLRDPLVDDAECWTCRGTGEGQYDGQSCSACRGSGEIHPARLVFSGGCTP